MRNNWMQTLPNLLEKKMNKKKENKLNKKVFTLQFL